MVYILEYVDDDEWINVVHLIVCGDQLKSLWNEKSNKFHPI